MDDTHAVIVTYDAEQDIAYLEAWLERFNPQAAARAEAAIRAGVRSLSFMLKRNRDLGRGLRELTVPFGNSAYVIRYLVRDETVIVLRVWHGRENRPGV